MTLLNPTALTLFSLAGVIILLHWFRARERKRDVSALFLWEGLHGDPRSRAARIRQRIDLFLILQLAALAAMVLALAQPALQLPARQLSSVAIVLDGSASMQTQTGEGSSRYALAVEEALVLMEELPASSTAVIQWSTVPEVLAHPGASASELARALRDSEPTGYADGTLESLGVLLGALGGAASFDRILLLSDHTYPELESLAEWIPIAGGSNRGLTAFSVRETGHEPGATAFVEVRNDLPSYQEVQLRISDGTNQTTLSLLLMPEESERFVVPFPSSRGTRFTASLLPSDDFPADDTRYFSLERRLDLRVRWLGDANRYLWAALAAATPVTEVERNEEADLIVAVNAAVPPAMDGDILLFHSEIPGFLSLSDPLPANTVAVADPASPLLRGVEPENFRLREAPSVVSTYPMMPILEAGDRPVLFEIDEIGRRILAFSPDLLSTNLPITVDFPLLIRNYVAQITRAPATLTHATASLGAPISLSGRGGVLELLDPNGKPVFLPDGVLSFRPSVPGHYTLHTDRGTFSLSANIAASESLPVAVTATASSDAPPLQASTAQVPLWPYALWLGASLLLAEGWAFVGLHRPKRRSR